MTRDLRHEFAGWVDWMEPSRSYARRHAEWRLFPQPTPNRVQSSLLELLRCEGGKESLKLHKWAQILLCYKLFKRMAQILSLAMRDGWRGVQEWLEFYSNAGRDRVLMVLLGRNGKCVWAVLTSNSIENSDHSCRVKSGVIALRNKFLLIPCRLCETILLKSICVNSWDLWD